MKHVYSVVILALSLVLCWTSSTDARFSYPEAPPYVRLSGVLLPLEDQHDAGLRSLTVFVHGRLWRFQLDAVEEVTQGNHARLQLRDLLWGSIRLYGSPGLLAPLQQPEIVGKHLTIEGHLHTRERRLLVTAAEETPAVARVH